MPHRRTQEGRWQVSDWRPFEPSREAVDAAAKHERDINRCNRHDNCAAADERARKAGRWSAEHCYDECCEECFGS